MQGFMAQTDGDAMTTSYGHWTAHRRFIVRTLAQVPDGVIQSAALAPSTSHSRIHSIHIRELLFARAPRMCVLFLRVLPASG